ncbi:glycosyl transferase family 2 [Denitrovibrio acetiphilus DSM 12809]|uniref:Glycosyl transferase family 2 n=1 Tax=Denitrovibrio acetiphilus (strain DSM 12809 / NBRC 114555 / N2460) TaxID=522772 RepID=D4H5V2_DENA2|nr:glycosyltransferase family 2 protein [Denitrovibrio acetiphilus]ADD69543.1 glycosyl transferase family 2 [Denitrovibrio acetiphilus DSM 12809]
MKITIITTTKNSEKTVRDTIESVIAQKDVEIEYILLDAMSTDSTLDIISSYNKHISKLIIEEDKGFYYAINKGISMASGDLIAILNSDDVYAYDHCLKDVVEVFQNKRTELVYADIHIVDAKDTTRVVRRWISKQFNRRKISFGWCPPHPAFFAKREIYNRLGAFDTDYKIAADYDIMLRFMLNTKNDPEYLNKVIVNMRNGGLSSNKAFNLINKLLEDRSIIKKHNLPGIITLLGKRLIKIKQFL